MALDGPLEGLRATIGRTDAVILLLVLCIFITITVLDILRLRKHDRLLSDIIETPLLAKPPEGQLRWLLVAAGLVALCVLLGPGCLSVTGFLIRQGIFRQDHGRATPCRLRRLRDASDNPRLTCQVHCRVNVSGWSHDSGDVARRRLRGSCGDWRRDKRSR